MLCTETHHVHPPGSTPICLRAERLWCRVFNRLLGPTVSISFLCVSWALPHVCEERSEENCRGHASTAGPLCSLDCLHVQPVLVDSLTLSDAGNNKNPMWARTIGDACPALLYGGLLHRNLQAPFLRGFYCPPKRAPVSLSTCNGMAMGLVQMSAAHKHHAMRVALKGPSGKTSSARVQHACRIAGFAYGATIPGGHLFHTTRGSSRTSNSGSEGVSSDAQARPPRKERPNGGSCARQKSVFCKKKKFGHLSI